MRDSHEYIQKQVWGELFYKAEQQKVLLSKALAERRLKHGLLCSPHIFKNNLCTLGCRSNLICDSTCFSFANKTQELMMVCKSDMMTIIFVSPEESVMSEQRQSRWTRSRHMMMMML